MSSEAITRNDLTAILNEVLPPTPSEYRTLLWTNPSPSAAFAAQTISLDLSGYDEIEVEYSDLNDASHSDKMPQIKARVGDRGLMGATFGSASADYGSGSIYNVTRRFAIGLSGITFDGGHGATASDSYSARNDVCVPLRIYGIQYDYVAPPQAEIADYIVEQGTSGDWKYRKWNSGVAECWKIYSLPATSWSTWGSWYYSNSNNVTFPTSLFTAPPTIEITRTGGIDSVLIATTSNETQITGLYAVRPNAGGTGNIAVSIHAIGTWK